MLTRIRLRLRSLFSRDQVERDLDEEFRYHLERQMDEDIAAGMDPEAARRALQRAITGVEQRKEECRDMRRVNLIENLLQDLRFALRQLSRNKGFTFTAILMLALGLCASVAIFAFVDAALLKPLPYPDPTRLVSVFETTAQIPRSNLSYLDYLDWKKLNKVFVSLEAYKNSGFIVTTPTGAQPARAGFVSAGFFRALGISPLLGRDFSPGEDLPGAPHLVLLPYATWQDRYAAKPDALGKTVVLDGVPFVIIGVLPRDFHFAPINSAEYYAALDPAAPCEKRRSCHNLYGVARLKDGVSTAMALADTTLIANQLEQQYPKSNRGQHANVVPLTEVIVGDIRPILLVLLGGAALLLLIACVNVAALLLVRSESRRREMSVRSALGASRIRLFRQFITEGLLLVAIGSALGIASAAWVIALLSRLIPAPLMGRTPFLRDVGFNPRVWAFAAAISLLSALIFAITPTLRLSFTEMREGLVEATRGSSGNTWRRIGSKLVVLELATAMVLLVCAGLLGQSLYRLLHVDLGFQPDHLATLSVSATGGSYKSDPQAVGLGRRLIASVSRLPGVQSAALVSVLPVSFNGNTTWLRFVGRPYNGEHNEVLGREVSSAYFQTVGATLLRGRYFTDDEDATKPNVTIINQSLAAKYFPGEDPIGKQMGNTDLAPTSLRQIIGVVSDIRDGALDADIWPAEYRPFNQDPDTYFSLVVRSSQSGSTMLPQLTAAVHQLDRGIATLDGTLMQDRILDSPSAYMRRSSASLVGAFAIVALLLGVIGIYGVIAYSVSQRTREIGVRMALGAERQTVCRLILREAGWLIAIGVMAGLAGSLAATTLMRKLLFGIESWDIPTLVYGALILALAALLASYIPARRAASVNPVEALRAE